MIAEASSSTGEEISGEFVVTCGDGAEVLEFVEEALDEIALAIKSEIADSRTLCDWPLVHSPE